MQICSLREYAATDAEALYEAARGSIAEVYPWLPWCHPEYSLAEAVEWASSRAKLAGTGQEYNLVIMGSEGGFLGGGGLNQVNRTHRYARRATGSELPPRAAVLRLRWRGSSSSSLSSARTSSGSRSLVP